jgi:predicted DNA-binding transcriptional regulator AlpA
MADLDLSLTAGRMLNQTALAKHFGVSAMAIWRWRQAGIGFPPSVEICGRHYWSIDAVERWKAERAAKPKPLQPVSKGARGEKRKPQADGAEQLPEASTRPRQPREKATSAAQGSAPNRMGKQRGRR